MWFKLNLHQVYFLSHGSAVIRTVTRDSHGTGSQSGILSSASSFPLLATALAKLLAFCKLCCPHLQNGEETSLEWLCFSDITYTLSTILNTLKGSLIVGCDCPLDLEGSEVSKIQFLPSSCSEEPSGVGGTQQRNYNCIRGTRPRECDTLTSGRWSCLLLGGWAESQQKLPRKLLLKLWLEGRVRIPMVGTANAKAQDYPSMWLWGSEVAYCSWGWVTLLSQMSGSHWLGVAYYEELRLWGLAAQGLNRGSAAYCGMTLAKALISRLLNVLLCEKGVWWHLSQKAVTRS
jgi:hypothetical protein